MPDTPQGQRYSQTHLPRGTPVSDSPRARVRLAATVERFLSKSTFLELMRRELGERGFWGIPDFYEKVALVQVLDSVTVVARHLKETARSRYETVQRAKLLAECRRIFTEENLAYRIDDEGGVHPLVDAEFSDLTVSTLRGLEGARYAATRASVEQIDPCLLRGEFTEAIRAVFDACENLFTMMYGGQSLKAAKVKEILGPLHQRLSAKNRTEQSAGAKMVGAFDAWAAWVDAAHNYRHASGAESPMQPDRDFAILMVSLGLAHLRWLAALNRMQNETRA